MPTTREEICTKLEELAQEPGFIYSLAFMLRHDLFLDPTEAADINWHERLSYQELTFIAGLIVKRPVVVGCPTEREASEQIRRTYALFEQLHVAQNARIMELMVEALDEAHEKNLTREESTQRFFGSGEVMTEPIFYSGSGAYDFQYWALAPKRYALDREWLRENAGLEWESAAGTTRALKYLLNPAFERPPKDFESFAESALAIFCVSPKEITGVASTDVEAFFQAFSLEPGTVNQHLSEPGQYNRLDSHPMIDLGNGRFFVPVHFNLSRSLYESPSYWMLEDTGYKDAASSNRGEATEILTAEMLVGVFGSSNVYRGVELRRGATVVGEIDVLALVGRKGLIAQCKSKRLTELARRGDTEQLKRDFGHAVQVAYEQGISCRELLRDPDVKAFTSDGALVHAELDDAYIACVVSDHYPSLTQQIHVYLQRSPDDPYPIALSIFDLEVLCHYLRDPFEFMYYVRQRVDLADYFHADEEMSLLAYHLKEKLFRSPGADMVTIAPDFAQVIDADYPLARGEHLETEASTRVRHEWKNAYYEQLVSDLKSSGEPGFVDAVFMLFDFSSDAIDGLFRQIVQAKELSTRDGKKHSVATVSTEGDAGISFVTRREDLDQIHRDSLVYAQLKKYEAHTTEWLGLGSLATSTRLADVVVYNRDPWKHDSDLEAKTQTLLGSGTARRLGQKIGRNDPCSCGSGIKFKRCEGR